MKTLKFKELDTSDVLFNFVKQIDYGVNYFIPKNEIVIEKLSEYLEVLKSFDKDFVLRIEKEKDEIFLEHHGFSLSDDIYKVISSVDNNNIPIVTNSDLLLMDNIKKAYKSNDKVVFSLSESLHGFLIKKTKKDLVFGKIGDNVFLAKKKIRVAVYDQIRDAFYSNKQSISFDLNDYNAQTIRCYSSAISNAAGVKFRCELSKGKITVFFKKEAVVDTVKRKIIVLLDELDFTDEKIMLLDEMKQEFIRSQQNTDDEDYDDNNDNDDGNIVHEQTRIDQDWG